VVIVRVNQFACSFDARPFQQEIRFTEVHDKFERSFWLEYEIFPDSDVFGVPIGFITDTDEHFLFRKYRVEEECSVNACSVNVGNVWTVGI
jgi:hypothetical protein